jgi:hypothetical protein
MAELVIHPYARTRVAALLKLGAPLAVVGGLILAARLYSAHIAPLPACDQLPWIRLVAIGGAIALISLVVLFYRSGQRIWRSGQFPAPGTPVIFPVKISTRWWARANAAALFFVAALSAAGLALWAHYFVFSQFGAYVLGLRGCGA